MARASRREPLLREDGVNCQTCRSAILIAERFCGGCGKAVGLSSGVEPESERRHVCGLYCDLVGSPPLSQRLDAGSYKRSCEVVVLRNDGFVAQNRGTRSKVHFGYPVAQERGEPGIGNSRFIEVARGEIADLDSAVLAARRAPVTADAAL